ncbi:Uncharacterised protein [Mycobacteroides abscessus subsp. abscessus]|nr:Uncharacterised protein [Mycobacteroides abscessus subsp. abscessus]
MHIGSTETLAIAPACRKNSRTAGGRVRAATSTPPAIDRKPASERAGFGAGANVRSSPGPACVIAGAATYVVTSLYISRSARLRGRMRKIARGSAKQPISWEPGHRRSAVRRPPCCGGVHEPWRSRS